MGLNMAKFMVTIDFKYICEKLCLGEIDMARSFIIENTRPLAEEDTLLGYRVFVNSLNHSIYNYILFFHDYNLYDRCCFNTALLHIDMDRERFYQAIDKILYSYHEELNNLNLVVYSPLVKDVLSYIKNNIREDITAQKLEEVFGESSTYINRNFKQAMGVSIHKYLKDVRLKTAKFLLLSTNYTIEYIAESSGYNSTSYFSTVFLQSEGLSPGAFREKYKMRKSPRK